MLGGRVEGSTNIDVKSESFKVEVGKLDKSKAYLVHCHTGRRSDTAVKIMEDMGFANMSLDARRHHRLAGRGLSGDEVAKSALIRI